MTSARDPIYEESYVARVLELALPEFGSAPVRRLARGWDHDVFTVGEVWAFRFARNDEASKALDVELPLLPWLAPQLPAAVPLVVHSGVIPNTGLRFAGHRALPGNNVCDAGWNAERRGSLAGELARFVRALHAIEPAAAPNVLRPEPLGRLDVARRGGPARAVLAELVQSGQLTASELAALEAALDSAEALELPAARRIIHCDLHRRNLLVDERGLSGVLDWVDVCVGHPAVDLAAAFEVLPAHAHPQFFAEYGEVPRATRAWAKWRAIAHTTVALTGATQRGDDGFAAACLNVLREMAI